MGSSPNWSHGFVPTAAQWNNEFELKQDDLGYTPVNRAGDTMAGKLTTFSSTLDDAGLTIQPGITPTSPDDGSVWVTSSGFFVQVNGATLGPLQSGTVSSVSFSAPSNEFSVSGSPITSTGEISIGWKNQPANGIFAGPVSGPDASPSFRGLVGSDLPNPTDTTFGGVLSIQDQNGYFLNGLSSSGSFTRSLVDLSLAIGQVSAAQIQTGAAISNIGYTPLNPANNLSDVANVAAARANLGVVNTAGPYRTTATNTTITAADSNSAVNFSASATANFNASSSLTSSFHVEIWAQIGATVTLTPNGSETINGNANLLLESGQKADVRSNGSNLFAKVSGTPLCGPQLQGYSFGLALSTNVTFPAQGIDIGVGSAASDSSPYYLMQRPSILSKGVDAPWGPGGGPSGPGGGLDTGVVSANATYYIWLIQRSDTLVTDALFSLSATAPTMPANYDRKRLLGSFVRTASVNGPPTPQTPSGLGNLSLLNVSDLVYSGTNAANVTFPIGTTLTALSSLLARNTAVSLYIYTSGTEDFTTTAGGSQLSGSWRARGAVSASRSLFERVS